MRLILLLILSGISGNCLAQIKAAAVEAAWNRFSAEAQFRYAGLGFEVVRVKDGAAVFNGGKPQLLSPASTQKIFTAAAALELLGPDFRYHTSVKMIGQVENGVLNGDLCVYGSGDPSLGSARFEKNAAGLFLQEILRALKEKNIRAINGNLVVNNGTQGTQDVPDGWTWQDIGNYYGAGSTAFNWRENQYDMILASAAAEGGAVRLLRTDPELYLGNINMELKAGPAGSGDNAYIYFVPGEPMLSVRGTIPPGRSAFTISGAIPNPGMQFLSELSAACMKEGIEVSGENMILQNREEKGNLLLDHVSPPLDSMVFWFLQKSVNLYGEALLKTLSTQQKGAGTTADGADKLTDFWKKKGIPALEMQLKDGSGLSPQNGVTASALNQVLLYARKQSWFQAFNNALPVINGLKMKSGTIGGVKCYAGFVRSGGEEYCFAIMANRFSGSSSGVTAKIFQLLNSLK